MKTRRLSFGLAIFLLFLLSPFVSWAHKVHIYAWVEGDRVFTESFFSDGKRAAHFQIQVLNEQGKRLLSGETDSKGLFSFTLPEKKDLKIIVLAPTGHRAEYNLSAGEISGGVLDRESKPIEKDPLTDAVPSMNQKEIQAVFEKVLDEKLRPIQRKLSALEKRGPTITEILGGIGYIMGLMGVAIYFSHRKSR